MIPDLHEFLARAKSLSRKRRGWIARWPTSWSFTRRCCAKGWSDKAPYVQSE